MITWIQKHRTISVHIVIIFLLWICLIITNYIPGTNLIGWDNVLVELDFGLNFKRAISAVWQEFQGLGLVGGHPHAADLPRIILLFLYSFILPDSALRYAYMFTMLFLGPIAMYALLYKTVLKDQPHHKRTLFSLIGAALYLLNLGTLQNFYISLSAFATFFGYLPLLILSQILLFEKFTKRRAIFFGVIQLLAAPFAFIPQIFIAYFGVFAIITGTYLINQRSKLAIGITLRTIIIFVAIHAYWLLPFTYFTMTNLNVRYESSFNILLSEKFFLQNSNRGGIVDSALLRGAYFDTTDYNPDDNLVTRNIFEPWIEHLDSPFVLAIGYTIFAVSLFGVIELWRKKDPWKWAWISIYFLGLFMLMNENPPFGFIFNFLRDNVSVFREAFRFPYNKFSIIAMVGYVITFVVGFSSIFEHLKREQRKVQLVIAAGSIGLLMIFTLPLFKGELFYNQIRQKVPTEYTELFEFFKQQSPTERIANFPQYTIYGWNYYDWGYHGSGFLWYGIEQPILDRNFDVWNKFNEAYYHEIGHALYSQDTTEFAQVLDKYDVSWVVLDNHVIAPNQQEVLYTKELVRIIRQLESEQKVTNLRFIGDILVAKVVKDSSNYFEGIQDAKTPVSTDYTWTHEDPIFSIANDYIVKDGAKETYPFVGIDDHSLDFDITSVDTSESTRYITLTKDVDLVTDSTLVLPSALSLYQGIPVDTFMHKDSDTLVITYKPVWPHIKIENESVWTKQEHFVQRVPNVTTNSVIFKINEDIPLVASNLTTEDTFIGQIQLGAGGGDVFTLYNGDAINTTEITASNWSDLINCADKPFEDSVTKEVIEGSVTIHGASASPCIFTNTNIAIDRNQVVVANIEFSSTTTMVPYACFANEGQTICNNNPREGKLLNQSDKSVWQVITTTKNNSKMPIWLTVSLDAYHAKTAKDLTIQSVKLSSHQIITTTSVGLQVGQDSIQTIEVPIPAGSYPLSISLPLSTAERQRFAGSQLIYNTNPRNCNPNELGTTEITASSDLSGVTFMGDNEGIACNTFKFAELTYQSGYLFLSNHTNEAGLPLHACLFNYNTQRCDIETRFKVTKEASYEYFIQPPMYELGTGYSLNISAESVGQKESQNILSDLYILPVPYNAIKSIRITQQNEEKNFGSITINNTKQNSIFMFSANVTVKENSAPLIFNQTHNDGWIMFGVPAEKVKANNWANAWILPQGNHTVFVFFIPQILEWFGFILLFGYALWIMRK